MRTGDPSLLDSGRAVLADLVTLTIPRRPYVGGVPPVGQTGTATILGDTYQTVVMPDGKEWLAENLKYTAGYGVWFNQASSNNGFGRYYLKSEAMLIHAMLTDGWRLPTLADTLALYAAIGNTDNGEQMAVPGASATTWTYATGTNTTGFSALSSGYREFGWWMAYPYAMYDPRGARWWVYEDTSGGEYRYFEVSEYSGGNKTVTSGTLNTFGSKALSVRLVRDAVPVDLTPIDVPAVIRWTSHDRPLRFQGEVFQGLSGTVWTRGGRNDQVGAEVSQLSCSVAGDLPVSWRTHPTDAAQVDLIDLSDLAVLGLLEGATLQIDEAVLDAFPQAPAGEAAADLPIGQVTTAVVLGEVVEAGLDALAVSMRVRSLQHRGGASVPRSVFAPACRWDFAGPECGYSSQVASRTVVAATEESVTLSALQAEDFAAVTPLSGRNMGIRRTLGVGDSDGLERTYALPTAWPWPLAAGTEVAVAFECSKSFQALTGRPSCTMLLRQARFGGFAAMPPPEGA